MFVAFKQNLQLVEKDFYMYVYKYYDKVECLHLLIKLKKDLLNSSCILNFHFLIFYYKTCVFRLEIFYNLAFYGWKLHAK